MDRSSGAFSPMSSSEVHVIDHGSQEQSEVNAGKDSALQFRLRSSPTFFIGR